MKLIINKEKINVNEKTNRTLSCSAYVPDGISKILWCLLCEDGCGLGDLSASTGTCRHISAIKFCLRKFTIL